MKLQYVVVCRNNQVVLSGPFDSVEDAAKYHSDPLNNPFDDPRWQCVMLTAREAAAPLRLVNPVERLVMERI